MLIVESNAGDLSFPTQWDEVTLKQFLRLTSCKDLQAVLECLASNVTALRNLPDPTADTAIFAHLQAFLSDMPDFESMPVPETVLGVIPIGDVGHGTVLQKWDSERWLDELTAENRPEDDDEKPEEERYALPYILATLPLLCIYLSPGLTGKAYDGSEMARSVEEQIQALPVTTALPVGAFFLRRRLNRQSTGQICLRVVRRNPSNTKWLKSLYQKWHGLKKIFRRNL